MLGRGMGRHQSTQGTREKLYIGLGSMWVWSGSRIVLEKNGKLVELPGGPTAHMLYSSRQDRGFNSSTCFLTCHTPSPSHTCLSIVTTILQVLAPDLSKSINLGTFSIHFHYNLHVYTVYSYTIHHSVSGLPTFDQLFPVQMPKIH